MPRKNYDLSEDTLDYLRTLRERNTFLKSETQAIEYAIMEYKKLEQGYQDTLADSIIGRMEEKYGNAFTRIRLGVNAADINSQTILEIWNSVLAFGTTKNYVPTSLARHPVLEQAQGEVKKRIAEFKQRKDNAKRKKMQGAISSTKR